jgi:hypothetical protein
MVAKKIFMNIEMAVLTPVSVGSGPFFLDESGGRVSGQFWIYTGAVC